MPRGTFHDYYCQCSSPSDEPLPTHTSTGDPPALAGVWVSILWSHCSFPLGSGVGKILQFFGAQPSLWSNSHIRT